MNHVDRCAKAAVKEKALIFLKVWQNAFFPYFCTPKNERGFSYFKGKISVAQLPDCWQAG